MRKKDFLFLFAAFLLTTEMLVAQNLPYKDKTMSVDKRVEDLLGRMTLEEKIDLLGGTGFATKPNDRLGIPELKMSDGPVGVRWGNSTAFPVSIAMAATWNQEIVKEVAKGIAHELIGKGRNVILGPCVNIARIPQGGRNFESFGEDPYLTSRITVAYIKGIQENGAAATVKHFAANNQEYERLYIDTWVSKRALNEIYFPAFKAAVTEADVLCVMCAYNKVNGRFAAENDYLLDEKLKKEWGFKGLVMSDWGAVHSSLPTANGALDLEMPTGKYMNKSTLLDAVKNGELPESKINEKVRRILTVIFKLGLFDKEIKPDESMINSKENREIAYKTSLESIVLLKNTDGILPLKQHNIKTLAVIGPNANKARTGGGGSALVSPINPVSPLEGLKNKINKKIKIEFAQGVVMEGDEEGISSKYFFTDSSMRKNGLNAEYYNNMNLSGVPKLERVDDEINFKWHGGSPDSLIEKDNFSVRWTGFLKAPKSGKYTITVTSDDGSRVFFNNELMINDWNDHAFESRSFEVTLEEEKLYPIKVEFYENGGDAGIILGWRLPGENLLQQAVQIAKNADCALLFVGDSYNIETEGKDRDNIELPYNQDLLIQKVAEVNKNVIVVLETGSPVVMDKWIDKVKAVVEAWFPGTEGGNAIADVLLGNYNPSGKLPITFPKKWEDCSAFNSYKKYEARTYYADDIYVGYRHFDKYNIEPLFPFGFGLSYTTFSYSNIKLNKNENNITVTFELKNTGNLQGEEIAQLYISPINPKLDRPVKELKAFKKISLQPGESKVVEMTIDKNSFAYFDEKSDSWKIDPGKYKILIGSSSRNLPLEVDVDL
ncbi:glycoside hydrolase family 3 C-terminal domain-containing protein [Melioribacteraceae bacterium 4301-Me]|uniref:glycoside hydrolase family 3 C-terminal domain-containing protein n=1 Tax=Pyranulibacter aquaticus TaxID=3163344 RepID=UPI003597EDFF